MSSLFQLGRTGLNAAQAGLNVTGHNIANVNTVGFSRQQSLTSTAGAQGSGAGYFGSGVKVDSVRRLHDSFLSNQLNTSVTVGASLQTFDQQIGRVNQLLADRTVGVSPALDRFFEGVNAVASAPASPEARQELIGRAQSLVSQFQAAQQFLADQRSSVNDQIGTTVDQINSYAHRISDLNDRIVIARASVTGQSPNDLLDQRDQLVAELNQLVRVTVSEQGDTFNLSVGNGQTLLAGGKVFPLQATTSALDPSRTAVSYTAPDGTVVELNDGVIDGGSLGGLLRFRQESLDVVQNELGRVAVGMALAFNELHAQGVDLNGNAGTAFFTTGTPAVVANGRNSDPSQLPVATYTQPGALTLSDYQVKFDGTDYSVTRYPSGQPVALHADSDVANGVLVFDGVRLEMPDAADVAASDTWMIHPTRYGARDVQLAVTDPTAIAAAGPAGGSANGENALALAQLQTQGIIANGTVSIKGAYAQLVNNVGVKAQASQTAVKAQTTLTQQSFAAQQAVSGVNLNEEYINLDFYVQHYNASARVIEVATNIFDTLLGLRT